MALVIPRFPRMAFPLVTDVSSFLESGLLLAGTRRVVLPPWWNLPAMGGHRCALAACRPTMQEAVRRGLGHAGRGV